MTQAENIRVGQFPSHVRAPGDRGMRARQVEEALHSVQLEGQDITPETAVDAAAYVEGEISLEELGRRTRARYGIEESSVLPEVMGRLRAALRLRSGSSVVDE